MTHRRSTMLRRRAVLVAASIGVVLGALAGAPAALAGVEAAPVPHWHLQSRAAPTNLPLNGVAEIMARAINLGDAEASGAGANKITITDELPAGVTPVQAFPVSNHFQSESGEEQKAEERMHGYTCAPIVGQRVECSYTGKLAPYEELQITIHVKVEAGAPAEPENVVTVKGGGAREDPPLRQKLKINGQPTHFGVEAYEMSAENEEFEPDTQAGSHPFQLTTTFNLNQAFEERKHITEKSFYPQAPALSKDLSFKLPAGLIGDVNAVPQCSDIDFGAQEPDDNNVCPNNTVVGVASVNFADPTSPGEIVGTWVVPVFNLQPAAGEPARFGFSITHVPVVLDTSVRTGEDYGVTVSVRNASQTVQVLGSSVTFWGIPGDKRHDLSRGWACLTYGSKEYRSELEPCEASYEERQGPAFLTLPTKCESLQTPVEGVAWNGEKFEGLGNSTQIDSENPLQLAGCGSLLFEPSLQVEPETHAASTPTGMNVNVTMPQEVALESNYEGRAQAAVSSTKLELPAGIEANPGAANGLTTCSVGQVGFHGSGEDKGAGLENELEAQGFTSAEASCPQAAKIGTVTIKTPDLEKELGGAVYLAEQDTDPFASPLVLYIVAEEERSKVLIKLAGEVSINPKTGQLVSDFKNTPQAPFEALTLHLWNGARASQATPASCGSYDSVASFTSSSNEAEPEAPSAPVSRESSFEINSGPNGSGCPEAGKLPFAPSFEAESTNTQAGAFSPFKLTIERPDGDAALKTISMALPPGLAAVIASVTPCPEPQAAEGMCGEESLIGESVSSSGLGAAPYHLPGKVYLTGPYNGAPFGLSSVTSAAAGPFHLGTIVVRSSININALTAAATINTEAAQFDPLPGKPQASSEPVSFSGLPEMVEGVPAQIKRLEVTVNRAGFEFNPTNCEPTSITGALTGYEPNGEATPATNVSSPFSVSGCASLPFAPKLTASVSGQGSKPNGVTFAVTTESAGLGQENIHKVDLTLPEVLPSRLETIQKACLEAVFDANPAACDEGSVIGEATVNTPVFKNPLKGPAYLVSHGGAAFPDVEFVLQGEGVTIILDGKTDIKKGITYSKFETAPDAPFTKFETRFPAGPHSALTSFVPESEDFNLCKHASSLVMPTTIVAQDGATIEETTPIALQGCVGVEAFVTGKVKIKKHSVKGGTLTLVVLAPSAGRIVVSANGLHKLAKSVTKAGTYTLKVKLGAKGKAALAHKHVLRTRVHVGFAPKNGTASSAPVTVKFH
jgi:hypothetical protein